MVPVANMKPQVDYTLYLVTDSTAAILGDRDLVQVVKEAVEGGQYLFSYFQSFLWSSLRVSSRPRSQISKRAFLMSESSKSQTGYGGELGQP